MKLSLWILIGLLIAGLAFWTIATHEGSQNPVFVFLVVVVFAVPPIGAFWMLYMSVRHEKKPLPLMLLAFVPYAFLWYYFERVRTGKYISEGRNPVT
jgi:hypothetical protein